MDSLSTIVSRCVQLIQFNFLVKYISTRLVEIGFQGLYFVVMYLIIILDLEKVLRFSFERMTMCGAVVNNWCVWETVYLIIKSKEEPVFWRWSRQFDFSL